MQKLNVSLVFELNPHFLQPPPQKKTKKKRTTHTLPCRASDEPSILLEGKGSYVVAGHWLLLQQFVAILVKRFHYITRNWKGLFSQIILPALFICVAMTVSDALLGNPEVSVIPSIVLDESEKD